MITRSRWTLGWRNKVYRVISVLKPGKGWRITERRLSNVQWLEKYKQKYEDGRTTLLLDSKRTVFSEERDWIFWLLQKQKIIKGISFIGRISIYSTKYVKTHRIVWMLQSVNHSRSVCDTRLINTEEIEYNFRIGGPNTINVHVGSPPLLQYSYL